MLYNFLSAETYNKLYSQHTGIIITTKVKEKNMEKNSQKCEAETYTNPILKYFAYEHLPPHLQVISKPFGQLAIQLNQLLPENPEKQVALRKLLESKDAAVRAKLG
jgi:hypothetical protein